MISSASGSTISSWWSVPNRSATVLASGSSLYRSCVKPIENVLTGADDASDMAATTAAESTPPERNAPSGTSEIIRRRVAARIWSRTSSCSSASEPKLQLAAVRELPVALHAGLRALEDEGAGGGQLAHVPVCRVRAGDPVEREVAVERLVVELPRDLGILDQRGQLGRERQHALALAVHQRLLSQTVARQHEPATARVPHRQREHPVQVLDEPGAVLLVEVDDHLGVAAGGEPVTGRLEPLTQLEVVVDLAVEDHDRVPVLAEDRLVARGQVDHAEALDPEPDALAGVHSTGVRPPMLDRPAHGLDGGGGHGGAVAASLTSDAAHCGVSLSFRWPP